MASDRKQSIIRAAIAANPDIDPGRIARIVTLVWTMIYQNRSRR